MSRSTANLLLSLLTIAVTFGVLNSFTFAAPVGQNLLTNAGFEDYLVNGWGDVHPPWGRGSQNSDPAPYEGNNYLKLTTPVPDATISQELDLLELGFDNHRLATGGYHVYGEGAMYSGNTQTAGMIFLGQYVGDDYIEKKIAQRKSPDWRVKSGTFQLRPGTTKVVYKFQAVTDSASVVNEAYLDAACLKIRENAIWAYNEGKFTDMFQAAGDHTTSGDFLLANLDLEAEVNVTHGRTWTTNGKVVSDGGGFSGTHGTVNIASGIWQANGEVRTESKGRFYIKITDNGTWNSAADVVFDSWNGDAATVDIISGQWNSSGKVSIGEVENSQGNVQIGEDGVWNSTGEVIIAAGKHSVNGGTWNASTVYFGMREPSSWYAPSTITLQAGGLLTNSDDLFVGYAADSKAKLVVDDSRFVSDGVVHVGCVGEDGACININSGSHWTSRNQVRIGDQFNSEGYVTIGGDGIWDSSGKVRLGTAAGGIGNVWVQDDAIWNSAGEVWIGNVNGSEGKVRMSGNAEWNAAGRTVIGDNGKGSLSIYSSSVWNTSADGSVNIGLGGDGRVALDGGKWYAQGTTCIAYDEYGSNTPAQVEVFSSSSWGGRSGLIDMTGKLTIGERGLLEIGRRGTVRLRNAWTNRGIIRVKTDALLSIEHSGTMTGMKLDGGTVSVLGADTFLKTYNATVGAYCTMSIDQGATVFVDSGRFFNVDGTLKMPNGDGTIRINNGTLKCGGKQVLLGGGTIEGSGQIFVGTKGLDLGIDGAINGTSPDKGFVVWGNLSGSGELNNVTLYGDLDVGNSPGTIEVGGLALSSSGSLTMELGGLVPGTEYDQILVSGTFALDGTLEVLWYDGFEAVAGDTFTLFDVTASGSLSGEFANLLLPTFTDPSLHWDITNLYTDGSITAVPEPMTWMLLLSMGIMLFVRRRIRKSK